MTRRLLAVLACTTMWASAITAQDFAQVRTLSNDIAASMKDSGRKTVAVVDFTDLQGSVTELGRFLAEEFSVALASTRTGIETINRTHLRAILAEHKLSASGLIDPQTARKLGQIVGVDTLLAGTLTPFGDTVRLSLQLIDASTARVVAASTADLPRTKAIDELLGRTVNNGSTTGTAPTGAPSKPTPSRPLVSAAGGFEFRLQRCRSLGGDILCDFHVTSVAGDRWLKVSADDGMWKGQFEDKVSRITDSASTQFLANHYTLGRFSGSYDFRETTLTQGLSVPATITFKDAGSGQTTVLTVLEIWCRGGSQTDQRLFAVRFKDVPLSR